MEERVILVDKHDNELGTEEKLAAHQGGGKLHRAFSIYIFHSDGRLMLQQRARRKYHCPGMWTNTCCSHPRKGEPVEVAAHRRLQEEVGFDCEMKEVAQFVYKAEVPPDLAEYEYLHVFVGVSDVEPDPNPVETESWKYVGTAELELDLQENPGKFSPWFKMTLPRLKAQGIFC